MEIELPLTIEKLDDIRELHGFRCGVDSMDCFIQNGLIQSIENHFCRAYIAKLEGETIAVFALSYDSIDLDVEDKAELIEGISNAATPKLSVDYKETFYSKRRFPALDIAYLAVKQEYRNCGIGESLIEIIAEKTIEQDFAGCQFLSVEALRTVDYSAVGFYLKCGFAANELPNANKDTLRMFRTLYSVLD